MEILLILQCNGLNQMVWLAELQREFQPKYVDVINDIEVLRCMALEKNEKLCDFNGRFCRYLTHVPKDMYTESYLKEIYLKILERSDREIWWQVVRQRHTITFAQILEEVCTMEVFKSNVKPIEEEPLKQKDQLTQKQMEERIAMLEILVSKQERPPRASGPRVCYNCGESGHISPECQKPRQRENKPSFVRKSDSYQCDNKG